MADVNQLADAVACRRQGRRSCRGERVPGIELLRLPGPGHRDGPTTPSLGNESRGHVSGSEGVDRSPPEQRSPPACPGCHQRLTKCPACGADMRGTEEKGVDVRMATDMISLAWVDNYDIAVGRSPPLPPTASGARRLELPASLPSGRSGLGACYRSTTLGTQEGRRLLTA